jgi:hypothetical protein
MVAGLRHGVRSHSNLMSLLVMQIADVHLSYMGSCLSMVQSTPRSTSMLTVNHYSLNAYWKLSQVVQFLHNFSWGKNKLFLVQFVEGVKGILIPDVGYVLKEVVVCRSHLLAACWCSLHVGYRMSQKKVNIKTAGVTTQSIRKKLFLRYL